MNFVLRILFLSLLFSLAVYHFAGNLHTNLQNYQHRENRHYS